MTDLLIERSRAEDTGIVWRGHFMSAQISATPRLAEKLGVTERDVEAAVLAINTNRDRIEDYLKIRRGQSVQRQHTNLACDYAKQNL